MDQSIKRACKIAAETIVAAAGKVAVLTGAGISVASGIPDFRSSQGLWARYDPMEYAEISSFKRDPEKVWTMLHEMLAVVEKARCNSAHEVLAGLEKKGLLKTVITQNIDGLHQVAGNCSVIEFHGTTRNLVCLECSWHWPGFQLGETEKIPPRCHQCDAIMKPEVVFFGEQIPQAALDSASGAAAGVEVMLVIGTSANVYPAADMPVLTKRGGGKVIEINLEPTPLSAVVADQTILGPAAAVLAEIEAVCDEILSERRLV
jgi:NAD-dependent deacetylase